MELLTFFTTDENYPMDKIIECFHKALELAEKQFKEIGEIENEKIIHEFRMNDPIIGEEH